MNRVILRLLGLLAIIVVSFVLARLLVAALLPGGAGLLLFSVPLVAMISILFYLALYQRFSYAEDFLPYFLLRLDFLLPLSALAMMLVAHLTVAPRFTVWQWGEQGTGTVQALSVEEREDIDLGTMRAFRVDYLFDAGEGESASRTSYVGRAMFDSLQAGDAIEVYYLPWWPGIITAGDPQLLARQATVLAWPMFVILLWLVGTAVASRRRYTPPPAPPYPAPKTALELLQRYDLDALLTDEDDAELWAAVLRKQFPMPEDESLHVEGLRFSLGEFAPAARLKMQPTAVTCFTRVDKHHLQRARCDTDEQTDADIDDALEPAVPLLLLYLDKVQREKRPLYSIILPRPSVGEDRLPVYTGICLLNGSASGETAYWEQQLDGSWQHSGEKLNWWMDGA